MIKLGRDPLARHTIRRYMTPASPVDRCTWCGSAAMRNGRKVLYVYWVDADYSREKGNIRGKFCNIQCANDYHH
jgi:hypothetical protein